MSTVEASVAGRATTPSRAAETAAEALRTLNHLTLAAPTPGAPGREDVGDVYRVIGEWRALTDRLPQACGQLAAGLQRLGDRGRLACAMPARTSTLMRWLPMPSRGSRWPAHRQGHRP